MKRLSLDDFISRSSLKHGNRYDYSKVIYENRRSIVKIICVKHGEFKQQAGAHMYGNGCPMCANNIKSDNENFIKKASKVHKNKYNYDKVRYIDAHDKITITCSKHGDYSQTPNVHLKGSGCSKCSKERLGDLLRKKEKQYIKEVLEIHKGKYNYSRSKYVNNHTEIEIICPKHGSFLQNAGNHLAGFGCSKCSNNQTSKPESELQEFVQSFYKIEINNRKLLEGKELDIYIPELNKAIEFNGSYWHYSKKHFKPGKHAMKSKLCRKKGIKLLHVREDLWKRDQHGMKQIIEKFLKNGVSI